MSIALKIACLHAEPTLRGPLVTVIVPQPLFRLFWNPSLLKQQLNAPAGAVQVLKQHKKHPLVLFLCCLNPNNTPKCYSWAGTDRTKTSSALLSLKLAKQQH